MSRFIHLHNHSEYSLLDAIARTEAIATRCTELGFDACALTDHGVMYGALEFYLNMQAAGVKPIIGCEVYVAPRKLTDKSPDLDRQNAHLVLLAKDHAGYVNLMKLTSIAHQHGFYYKPRIDAPTLSQHQEGLVALTACRSGVVARPFHREGEAAAREALQRYLRIFGADNLFVELQYHLEKAEDHFRQWARDEAAKAGVRLVATNDCHYIHREDARAHDIALCLRDKKLLTDTDRKKYSGPEYYIKTEEEMAELFADYPEALANTAVVAGMCNLELDLNKVHFPRFTITADEGQQLTQWIQQQPSARADQQTVIDTLSAPIQTGELVTTAQTQAVFDTYLRMLTLDGAQQRYGELSEAIAERIEYELSIIISKGLATYFLVCAEFCQFARQQNISVGPGRGSAAGSVVAYCLEITDLDPIKYGLYFERFLNPERVELPDFDIDFCMRRRDEVIEHVKQKYGPERVALIITYSRLRARAVIKAVGRTRGLEFKYVDKVTKEIHGLDPSIQEAVARSPILEQMIADDEVIAELVQDAQRLEGIAAHHSVHAAGLVIAPEELYHYVPTQPHKDSDLLVTQYAMDMVPKTGLVKFDFLGLRNLTIIQDTVDYIREQEGVALDPRALPDDDEETFKMLQRGDAYGVFQFEAPQVVRMLVDGHPESVADLAAINAANRPGPIQSGNTELYLKSRRSGARVVSPYPSIEEIVAPTGGVLLFQEQVLEIVRKLGGFTLGEADVVRKAMGKKLVDVMEEQKKKFIAGASERGVPAGEAQAIWDMTEKFAGYGFNKAHSTCYAWIAYQTAFLKCHYPHYYMCAMLNCYMGDAAKLAQILAQCRKMRIPVLPPSVNEGEFRFTPTKDGGIIFGLGGIKGIGGGPVQTIVKLRQQGGPFKTLAGFFKRTRGKGINKKVLQSLAMAGAFDCIIEDRIELIKNLDEIEDFMRGPSKQEALFGNFDDGAERLGAAPTREITSQDVALLEKRAIGLFLTHHPFADHQMYQDQQHLQLAQFEVSVHKTPESWQDRQLPREGLAGLLTNVQVRIATSTNRTYAKARLEDPERSVSLIIWPKAYEEAREAIHENSPVVVWGRVQIPEAVLGAEEAWAGLEVVADRVEAYTPQAGNGEDLAADMGKHLRNAGNGGAEEPQASTQSHDVDTDTEVGGFSPLPMPIKWEIDLKQAEYGQLEKLAKTLEGAEGEHEVRMLLKEVSGQLKRIKVNRRFFTNLDVAQQLEEEFPFITPLS